MPKSKFVVLICPVHCINMYSMLRVWRLGDLNEQGHRQLTIYIYHSC